MRATVLATVLLAAAFTGCTSDLSTSDFELTATEVGWKVGQEALFFLRFTPEGNAASTYDVDPVFAVTEVRYEKDGLNAFGDYETKRAADLAVTLVNEGVQISNFTLTPSQPQIGLRIKVPDQLDSGEYRLEVKLFKVGWIKSDLFRIAV